MNERIQQLHEEAMKSCDEHRSDILNYHHIYREKFAKLIIKECAEVVQDFVNYRLPASEYPEGLKNHFGVED